MYHSSARESSLFAIPASVFRAYPLAPEDLAYPQNLADLGNHPHELWYRGNVLPADALSVAIVGSRSCSELGRKRAFRLARELASEKVTIVSGLAVGVDTAAHQGALSVGGRTIAVLGTGVLQVRPRCNQALAQAITQNGALISQFHPSFTGYQNGRHHLARNAVISGFTQLTIVVEAEECSGTSNTIRCALAQGRSVGLLKSLVSSQSWAEKLAEHPQVFVISDSPDVLERLAP